MTDFHPDHRYILELARAALQARDNRQLWRQNIRKAAEEHGFFCDALWAEIERQLDEQFDRIAVIEHPSIKQRRMIANIRREIVAVAQHAIEEALNDLADGPMMMKDDDE